MKILCNMGIPMGLQYSITAIGSVILQTAVNSLGSMGSGRSDGRQQNQHVLLLPL